MGHGFGITGGKYGNYSLDFLEDGECSSYIYDF